MQYRYQKTPNCILISNPMKKLQKTYAKKVVNKKIKKNGVLTFITVCKSFRPMTFLGDFCTVFQRIRTNLASNLPFHDTYIEFMTTVCFFRIRKDDKSKKAKKGRSLLCASAVPEDSLTH
jgi:hypothetical protein